MHIYNWGTLNRFFHFEVWTVRPGLKKFRYIGIFLKLLRVYLVLGKNLNLLWRNFAIGQIFISVNGQLANKISSLRSHWLSVNKITKKGLNVASQVGSENIFVANYCLVFILDLSRTYLYVLSSKKTFKGASNWAVKFGQRYCHLSSQLNMIVSSLVLIRALKYLKTIWIVSFLTYNSKSEIFGGHIFLLEQLASFLYAIWLRLHELTSS